MGSGTERRRQIYICYLQEIAVLVAIWRTYTYICRSRFPCEQTLSRLAFLFNFWTLYWVRDISYNGKVPLNEVCLLQLLSYLKCMGSMTYVLTTLSSYSWGTQIAVVLPLHISKMFSWQHYQQQTIDAHTVFGFNQKQNIKVPLNEECPFAIIVIVYLMWMGSLYSWIMAWCEH